MIEAIKTRSFKMAIVSFDEDGSQSAFYAPDNPESPFELEIVTLKGDEESRAAQFTEVWKETMDNPTEAKVYALNEAERRAGAEALTIVIPRFIAKHADEIGVSELVNQTAKETSDKA